MTIIILYYILSLAIFCSTSSPTIGRCIEHYKLQEVLCSGIKFLSQTLLRHIYEINCLLRKHLKSELDKCISKYSKWLANAHIIFHLQENMHLYQ